MPLTTFTFVDATDTTKTAVAGSNGSSQLAGASVLTDADAAELKGQKARAASLPVVLSTEDAALLADLLTITTFQARIPTVGQKARAASIPTTLSSEDITALTPPAAITGFATSAKQDTLISQTDGIEGSLSSIDGKIPASPSTAGNQTALNALIGEVQASPSANTLLDRLKALLTGIILAAGDNLVGRFKLSDGTTVATVRELGANDALNVAISDGSGNQVTSFGGGTEYTEGDTDATITGAALLWEDAADTLRATSEAKPLPVRPVGVLEVTGSVTSATNVIAATDVGNYRSVAVQITGIGSATITWEVSNDGTNYVATVLQNVASGIIATTTTANGIFFGPIAARYFRARVSTYGSGTIVGTAEFSPVAYAPANSIAIAAAGSGSAYADVKLGGDAQGASFSLAALAYGMLFNNATYDRQRSNFAATILASAARTATNNTDATNYNARTLVVTLNITAAPNTASTLTLAIRRKESISSNYVAVLTAAAITGSVVTGAVPVTNQYTVALGVTVAANVSASEALARTMNVLVTHSNGDSWTYSISADWGL